MNYTLADGQASCSGPKCKNKFSIERIHLHNFKVHQSCCVRIEGIAPNVGVPQIVDGYECDADTPCICPYDSTSTQTFATYQDYKNHLYDTHDSLPFQKRRHTKPCSEAVRQLRRERARNQHDSGVFLNTHVKKETLVEFVRLYDDFLADMFRDIGYEGDDHYKRTWNDNIRIRPGDLDRYTLESMVDNRKNAWLGRYRRRDAGYDED